MLSVTAGVDDDDSMRPQHAEGFVEEGPYVRKIIMMGIVAIFFI
jgi:hypothetical protein